MQDAQRTIVDVKAQRRRGGDGRTRRGLMRLAGVLPLLACAAAAPGAPETGSHQGLSETIVRLYPQAVVTSERILLGDVAEIRAEADDLLARREIATSPKIGESRTLDLAYLQRVLGRAGVDLSRWVFRGSTQCVVTRPGRGGAATGEGEHGSEGSAKAGAPLPDGVRPDTLAAVLHQHIAGRLAHLGGVPLLQFSPVVQRLLDLSTRHYRFKVTDRSDRLLGLVPLEVTIIEGELVKQVVPVLTEVSLRKPVVIADRAINQGETIQTSDLALADRVFKNLNDITLTDLAPLAGQRAKRFIREGAMVDLRDVEPVPLVLRNDLVTVWVRRGRVAIKGSAKAMSSAGYGETVELTSELSRKDRFTGVVTGPKTVELPGASRTPLPGLTWGGGPR